MSRSLTTCIQSVTGTPREGLQVDAINGGTLSAITDAGGVFVLPLEPGDYRIPFTGAVRVDGVAYPAGTAFRVTIPEGEGPIAWADALTGIEDASLIALLQRIEVLETAAQIASPAPAMPQVIEPEGEP